MANKKNNNKRKVNKNLPKTRKVNIKKPDVKKTKNEDINVKTFIKIMIVLLLGFGILYGGTYLMQSAGMFDAGYTAPEKQTPIISYEDGLIGTVFNRPESEYYVLFYNFDGEEDEYLKTLLSKNEKTLYKIDMNYGTNKNYISETSNRSAQSSENLKINGYTLIKINNGRNTLYIEGLENIKAELEI